MNPINKILLLWLAMVCVGIGSLFGCQTVSTLSSTSGSGAPAGSGILTLKITQNTTTEAATFKIVISQGSSIITSSEAASNSLGSIKEVSFTLPNGSYTAEAFIDENNNKSADNSEYYDRKDNITLADNTQNVELAPNIQKSYWGTNTISGTIISSSSESFSQIGLYIEDLTQNSAADFYGRIISKEAALISYKFKVKNGTYYVAAFTDLNGNNARDNNDYVGVFNWNGEGSATAEAITINNNNATSKGFVIYIGKVSYGETVSWDITTIEADIGDTLSNGTSIAIDGSGYPHLSYYQGKAFTIVYAFNSTGEWAFGVPDYRSYVGKGNSIAVDSKGKVHFSYFDTSQGKQDVVYSTNSTGAWVQTSINSNLGTAYITTSIALDSNDKVHISYYDYTNGDLKYATNISGNWEITTVDSQGDAGLTPSLAVDSLNKIHISYYDGTNGDLKYATNAAGDWTASTVDSEGNVGSYTSLALDSSGKVHIAYKDSTNKALKYATNKSGTWVTETVDSNQESGSYCDIDIDSNGKAHISYYKYNNASLEGSLKYATNRSGSWMATTVEDAVYNAYVSIVGTDTSIKVDNSGKVHISYFYNPGSTSSSSVKIAVSK